LLHPVKWVTPTSVANLVSVDTHLSILFIANPAPCHHRHCDLVLLVIVVDLAILYSDSGKVVVIDKAKKNQCKKLHFLLNLSVLMKRNRGQRLPRFAPSRLV
jgi:hypothetical protein